MLPEPEFGETRKVPMALFRPLEISSEIKKRDLDCLASGDDLNVQKHGRIAMREPADFTLRRIPLEQEQISSFYHVTSKESFWPILHTSKLF